MADSDDSADARLHQNQPYDESLEVPDSEEVASNYTPTPRVSRGKGRDRGESPSDDKMFIPSDDDDDDFDNEPPAQPVPRARGAAPSHQTSAPKPSYEDEDDDDDEASGSSEGDDDDEVEGGPELEGAYDPAEYDHLPVTSEIKELFQYITRYTPQTIELESKLKPFIPDFIPAVGDIDAFIKVGRVDSKHDTIGLTVLDEPCAKQSDPTVLDLQLRATTKQTTQSSVKVRSVEHAEKNPKAIQNWIESISDLHRSKPPPNVHYTKNMPDIDSLMQEWPAEFEDLLRETGLPTADIDCDLTTYVDMICALLDIPIYKSKVQSLHVLFTLFSEFKNSQHFKSLAEDNKLDGGPRTARGESDRLVL